MNKNAVSDFKIKVVLVIARPRLRAFYEYIAPRVFDGAKVHYVTENRGLSRFDGYFLSLYEWRYYKPGLV